MTARSTIAQTGILPEGKMLLCDTNRLQIVKKELIAESANAAVRKMVVTGLFQECDIKNANGRVYPKSIMRKAVDDIQEELKSRSVVGEFDHPPDAKVHLDRLSHVVTKVWMDGRRVYGEAEILEGLPYGKQLKTLFESDVQVGISSRGMGDMEVKESNGEEVHYVTEGFAFITWDVVADPSVTGARLTVMESRNRLLKPKIVKEDVSKYERLLIEELKSTLRRGIRRH